MSNNLVESHFSHDNRVNSIEEKVSRDVIEEDEIINLISVITEQFKPKALSELSVAYNKSGQKFDIEIFARDLMAYYNKHGNIGEFEKFFEDGGKSFIDMIKRNKKIESTKGVDKTESKTSESVTEPTESVIKKADSVTETPENENAVPYTDKEKQNWENSKDIIVYESDEQFESFVEKVLKNEDTHKKIYFGKVPDTTAQMVLDKTGVDVSGHNIALKGYEIRKILLNSHGDEKVEAARGQEPITTDDLKNIPSVITNPDDVSLSEKEYEGKPALLFEKTIDGKNYVVAYVSRKHHDIAIQTMYKKKKPCYCGKCRCPFLYARNDQ